MHGKGLRLLAIFFITLHLSGCITNVWTGANVVYDRHNWYRKFSDFDLAAAAKRALYRDQRFKCPACTIEIAVVNQDLLMAGHVPSEALRREASMRVRAIPGIRRFFDELAVSSDINDPFLDSWITTKIRSEILADSSIDPNQFKIITCDRIVYLMGDVMPEQAEKVVLYAREWSEVKRVVKLFRYYQLSNKPVKTADESH